MTSKAAIGFSGAGLFVTALVLPWWYTSNVQCLRAVGIECPRAAVSVMQAFGFIDLVLIGTAAAYAALLALSVGSNTTARAPLILLASLAICLTIYTMVDFPDAEAFGWSLGLGPFVALIAGFLMLIFPLRAAVRQQRSAYPGAGRG